MLDAAAACAEHGWLWLMEADVVLRGRGDPRTAERLAHDATRLGRELGVADLEAVGLGLEGVSLVARGEVPAGMDRLDEASALAAGEDFTLALSPGWTLCCVVSACEDVGDIPRAAQWCRAMQALGNRLAARNLMGVCRSAYGNVLALGGDWEAAEAQLVDAVDDLRATRPAMAGAALVRLGELRARQGRVEEARALFAQAHPHPSALLGEGRLALAAGDPVAAADAAERVLRRLAESGLLERLPALELLARAQAALGDHDAAALAAAAAREAGTRLGTPYLRGRAHLTTAEVASAAGDHHAARRAAEDAVDCLTDGAAPYEAALARLVLARSLLALDRVDAAVAEARTARDVFAALGAAGDLTATDELLAGGAGPGRRQLSDLTEREIEVLGLVARGLSDAQIAKRLVLSPHTVHRHVANVRAKLRLPSRSAAVAYAAREGLL
jgi:ATP/maltotriose-dependent transcriptional regulator MalT